MVPLKMGWISSSATSPMSITFGVLLPGVLLLSFHEEVLFVLDESARTTKRLLLRRNN